MSEVNPSRYESSRRLTAVEGTRGDVLESLNRIESLLSNGDGNGTFDAMERIAKLEARADMADQRMVRVEDKLDRVLERLGSMPTTNGLWGMIATVIGVALTMIGIVAAILALP